MSSTQRTAIKYSQCVSEKSTPFKPIKLRKIQCPIHRSRVNCRATTQYDPQKKIDYQFHVTTIETVYLNYNHVPYFMELVPEYEKILNVLGTYYNANEMYAYVHLLKIDQDEIFYGIDEAGEKQMNTLSTILKSLIDSMKRCGDNFVLMADEQQIDIVYSIYRTIILPQRMILIYGINDVPNVRDIDVFSVPNTILADDSQKLYRSFLIYNTMLTVVLKQINPFNTNKNISIILRTLGKCPINRDRIKCCDLKYGGNVPGHIFCAPREIVKLVYHYAKWAKTPNNYKRYYELITNSINRRVLNRGTPKARKIAALEINDVSRSPAIIMDWYYFFMDLCIYFGVQNG